MTLLLQGLEDFLHEQRLSLMDLVVFVSSISLIATLTMLMYAVGQ